MFSFWSMVGGGALVLAYLLFPNTFAHFFHYLFGMFKGALSQSFGNHHGSAPNLVHVHEAKGPGQAHASGH